MSERFVNVDRDTPMLLPVDLRDWVRSDDMVHFVLEAVEGMALGTLKVNRRGSGSPQYPPQMMLALLIYCLLIVAWPGMIDGYRWCFRAGGNLVFSSFGSSAVYFEPFSSNEYGKDTTLTLVKQRPFRARGATEISVSYIGYRPTAFMLALVLATPVPWRRKLYILFWCLVWLNIFVVLRVLLSLYASFGGTDPRSLLMLGANTKFAVHVLHHIFVMAPAAHYMVPGFIWILVAFRRGDVAKLFSIQERRVGKHAAKS